MRSYNRNVDHIYTDICIRRITVAVGPVRRVFFRFFDLVFLNDFFTLDHAPPAVRAFVFSVLPYSTAVGAVCIVFDSGPCDLLFGFRFCTKTGTAGDPPDKLHKREDRCGNDEDQDRKPTQAKNDVKESEFII